MTASHKSVNIGESVTLTVWTADNVGVVSRTLTVNGTELALSGNQAVYTADTAGTITAQATAVDGAGLTATANVTFTVTDPNDTTPPVVNLDEDDCKDVTDLYSVTGSITEEGSFTYQLLYREKGTEEWTEFARGEGIDTLTGELGLFDPTMLINTVYEIALVAQDANGNTGADTSCALVDGQMKLGPVILPRVDLECLRSALI